MMAENKQGTNIAATDLNKKVMLIVDDEDSLLSSLRRPLQVKYHVDTTTQSLEVMTILSKKRVDAILLDIRMPGINGIELLKEIKFMYPHIAVLMMTGHGDEEDAIAALKLGASSYINKPVDLYLLLNEIEKVAFYYTPEKTIRDLPNILLIDDEPNFIDGLKKLLKPFNYSITSTTSTVSALKLLKSKQSNFDIIIIDIKMPKIDGLEFIERIEMLHLDIITILVTGKSSQELAINAIKHGAFDYIRKPFDIKELISAIERSTQKLRINREMVAKNEELVAKELSLQELNAEISSQKRFLENIVKSISNMLIITDEHGKIKTINDAALNLLGYTSLEIIGLSFGNFVKSDDFKKFLMQMKNDTGVLNKDIYYVKKNKETICVLLSESIVKDSQDSMAGFVFVAQDISGQKESENRLYQFSYYDSLTKLTNRLYFEVHAKEALTLAKKNKSKLAFLYIDLDGFKTVNDRLGHAVGDLLLVEVAKRLQSVSRFGDFIARIGGDEFISCILGFSDVSVINSISDRLIKLLSKPFYIGANELSLSISIGISIYPDSAKDYDQLFKNADIALYKSKYNGRNQYQYFTKQLDVEYANKLNMENALHFAISRQEFYMVYQPIYHLKTKKIIAIEALIRWNNNDLGNIDPQTFIPVAEYIGLIDSISQWSIDETMKQFSIWQKTYDGQFKLALNISTMELTHKNYLVSILDSSCEKYGLNPKDIELELTETAIMRNLEYAKETLSTLSRRGFGIIIDDFGQGYSSLSLLSTLPVTGLKIDKQFVAALNDAKNKFIIKAIISLAKSLSLTIVAEGIEMKEQQAYLSKLGCHYGQGYFLCKPQLAERITHDIKNHKLNY